MDQYTIEIETGRQCGAFTQKRIQCSRLGKWTVCGFPFCKQHLYSDEANGWRRSRQKMIRECAKQRQLANTTEYNNCHRASAPKQTHIMQ